MTDDPEQSLHGISKIKLLEADNARLRALLKETEFAYNYAEVCTWCLADVSNRKHDDDCEAFNPDGSVK